MRNRSMALVVRNDKILMVKLSWGDEISYPVG